MPINKVRTAYVHLTTKKVETTQEILKDKVYADLDEDGRLVGFEFISPYSVELDGELT